MTPAEERACYERAAKKADNFTATGLNTIVNAVAAAIRALPLTTESAATQEQLAKSAGQIGIVQPVNGTDKPGEIGVTPASAADPTNLGKLLHRAVAPAQSSTATVQCISGDDTLTECEVLIVGQGETAQGAAPLEPVAWIRHRLLSGVGGFGGGVVCEFSETPFGGFDDPAAGDKDAAIEPLYTIPEGYAVVPPDLTAKLIEHWKFGQFAADFDQPLAKTIREDLRQLCAMLAAGRVK